MQYTRFERIQLKTHPTLSEKWVQDRIADDPSLLGLGDIIVKDKERIQPRAGRLDLLLQEVDGNRRYEVELQLGSCDESHIIRTIEYWDIERKRYPQYDHVAVIIAEDITSRFLNVISLFNGTIPLIAIQMSALSVNGQIGLVFTIVLDQIRLGLIEEDEELLEATDREYWENYASAKTLAMVDSMLQIARQFDEGLELKYNKFYIGLARDGQPDNFAIFRPKKAFLRFEPRLAHAEEAQRQFEAAGLDLLGYDDRWGRYRIRLSPGDIDNHRQALTSIMKDAFEASRG